MTCIKQLICLIECLLPPNWNIKQQGEKSEGVQKQRRREGYGFIYSPNHAKHWTGIYNVVLQARKGGAKARVRLKRTECVFVCRGMNERDRKLVERNERRKWRGRSWKMRGGRTKERKKEREKDTEWVWKWCKSYIYYGFHIQITTQWKKIYGRLTTPMGDFGYVRQLYPPPPPSELQLREWFLEEWCSFL